MKKKHTLFIISFLMFCILPVSLVSCGKDISVTGETTVSETADTEAHSTAPETQKPEPSPYAGPDGEEYFGVFHGGLFGLSTELTDLVPEEEYLQYTDKTFAGSFDFNQRSFCRYFGITEEAYREAVSIYNRYDIYGEAGKYRAEQYPIGIFGTYEDFIDVFVREEHRLDYRTEEWMPAENCVHTYTFHTISDELIAHVGEEAYRAFRGKYAGGEEYNILNFLSYFYLDEKTVSDILNQSNDPIPAYNVEYLFGDEAMQREYFLIREYQSDEGTKLYYGLPAKAEFQRGYGWYYDMSMHYMICSFLRNDWETFAGYCGVAPEVYSHMRNMKIGEYELKTEMIPAEDDPNRANPYHVLSFEVLESTSEVFPVGEHELVWVAGLNITFEPRETFLYSAYTPREVSQAELYLLSVGSDRDFTPIAAENNRQFGLCDFIIGRLNVLHGNSDPRTEEEIGDYAEKYLGVDRETLSFHQDLVQKVENGYQRIGRGGGRHISTVLSEEIRDGITVVTVQFWADESKTVPSRKVEFYMELLDGEYKPLYSVILEDSDFKTKTLST